MPKLKTHRGAAKRFRKAAGGRIKCRRATRNHILTKRTTKNKRQLRSAMTVGASDKKAVDRMLDGS